jgi:hypothetical protein
MRRSPTSVLFGLTPKRPGKTGLGLRGGTGLRGSKRGEEDQTDEGQCEARSEEGRPGRKKVERALRG